MRYTLEQIYTEAFNSFRNGDYERIKGRPLKGENRKHLNEQEAHEATLNFILWLYGEQRGLSYNEIFKMMLKPNNILDNEHLQPDISWHRPNEVVEFVSYETKITMNA